MPVVRSGLIKVQLDGPPEPPPLLVRYTLLVAEMSRWGFPWSIKKGALKPAGSAQAGSLGEENWRQGPASSNELKGLVGSFGVIAVLWRTISPNGYSLRIVVEPPVGSMAV